VRAVGVDEPRVDEACEAPGADEGVSAVGEPEQVELAVEQWLARVRLLRRSIVAEDLDDHSEIAFGG
jgi:hypothetical protein